jgi:hypothetical protein
MKTIKEVSFSILESAEKLGGQDLREHVARILRQDADKVYPLEDKDVLKYIGIGPKKLMLLKQLGIVANPVKNEVEASILSSCVRFILTAQGIKTKAQAKKAILSGELRAKGLTNYGVKRHAEVCKWVGLPVAKSKLVTLRFTTAESLLPAPHDLVLMASICPPLNVPGYFDGTEWRIYSSGEKFPYKVEYWSHCPEIFQKKEEA